MDTATPVHAEFLEPKLICSNKSPKESPNSNVFLEFITDIQSLVTKAQTIWLRHETEKRNFSNEIKILKAKCIQLRNLVNTLKNKPCDKCAQLQSIIQQKEQEMKRRDDLLMSMMKSGLAKNHHSYNVFSQMVYDTVGDFDTAEFMNSEDPVLLDTTNKNLYSTLENEVKRENSSEAEVKNETEIMPENSSRKEASPVVLKRSRSSKRRIMCISSKKKNKHENGDYITNGDLDLDFPHLTVVNINNDINAGTTQIPVNIKDCITSLSTDTKPEKNLITLSPEVLNDTLKNCTPKNFTNLEEPSPEVLNKSTDVRRSLTYNSNVAKLHDNDIKYVLDDLNNVDPENSTFVPENLKQDVTEKPLNSLNVNVINNVNAALLCKTNMNENVKIDEKNKKMKWDLRKSREPTNNKKLKQTLLSTATFEQKLDITTLENYKGGIVPSEAEQEENTDKNFSETFFEPLITSTSNDVPTMKEKTPVKMENSFDVIPSKSPNYKYRRDAVRKKADRRKLPGQGCTKCFNFYMQQRNEAGETKANELLNKCSRHRDKFAIMANTPPGLWNPGFDTDEEMDK